MKEQKLSVDGKEYRVEWGSSHLTIDGGEHEFRKITNSRLATMLGHMSMSDIIRQEINGIRHQTTSGSINRSWQSRR